MEFLLDISKDEKSHIYCTRLFDEATSDTLIFLWESELLSVNFYSKWISIFLRIKSIQVDKVTKENPL